MNRRAFLKRAVAIAAAAAAAPIAAPLLKAFPGNGYTVGPTVLIPPPGQLRFHDVVLEFSKPWTGCPDIDFFELKIKANGFVVRRMNMSDAKFFHELTGENPLTLEPSLSW